MEITVEINTTKQEIIIKKLEYLNCLLNQLSDDKEFQEKLIKNIQRKCNLK